MPAVAAKPKPRRNDRESPAVAVKTNDEVRIDAEKAAAEQTGKEYFGDLLRRIVEINGGDEWTAIISLLQFATERGAASERENERLTAENARLRREIRRLVDALGVVGDYVDATKHLGRSSLETANAVEKDA